MGRTILAAAAVLALVPTLAQAAEPPCLTAAEFTAVTSYALPSLIRGAASRCGTALPAGAYLKINGETLAKRYEPAKAAAWPVAKAAFVKVGTVLNPQMSGIFGAMPDGALRPLVDGSMASMVGQRLPTTRCNALDRAVQLIAPLPAANAGELVGLAAGLMAKDGRARLGQFTLCPA